MKINRLLLINYLSKAPNTEYFCISLRENLFKLIFVTPNSIFFKTETFVQAEDIREIYISFDDFFSIINTTRGDDIYIKLVENYLQISSGNTVLNLSLLQPPEIKYDFIFETKETINVPMNVFLENIFSHQKIVKKAPQIYDSLLMRIYANEIQFQSTDIYRIFLTKITEIYSKDETIISFPKDVINFFLKSLKTYILEENIYIQKHSKIQNYLCIKLDNETNFYFFQRTKTFTNFKDIKNKFFFKEYVEVEKESLVNVLREVEIVSKFNLNTKYFSKLSFDSKYIHLESRNEKNDIETKIEHFQSTLTEPIQVNLNTNSFSEILKIFPDKNIRIFIQDQESPILIQGDSGNEGIVSILSEI